MLNKAIAVTIGIALTAAPGVAQTEHQHQHAQAQGAESEVVQGTVAGCPIHPSMAMMGGMMGMEMGGMMSGGMGGMEEGHMLGHGMMDHQMMASRTAGIEALLERKDDLNLSEAQISNLETIRDRVNDAVRNHMEMALEAGNEAAGILAEDPTGLDGYSEAIRAATSHMAEAHIAMIRSGLDAENLLTSAQRDAALGGSGGAQEMHHGGTV